MKRSSTFNNGTKDQGGLLHQRKNWVAGSILALLAIFWMASLATAQTPSQVMLPELRWLKEGVFPVSYTEASRIVADSAGNIVVSQGASVIKYGADGTEIWRRANPGFGVDILQVDSLNSFYLCGLSNGALSILKFDSEGAQLWTRSYQRSAGSMSAAVDGVIGPDDNLLLTGNYSHGTTNGIVTVKYSATGSLEWASDYNGPLNQDTSAAMAVDADGNCYVAGTSSGFGSASDMVVVKHDPLGGQAWVSRYNGPENQDDVAEDVAVDSSGNVFVTGGSGTFLLGNTALVGQASQITVKIGADGSRVWAKAYQDGGNYTLGRHGKVLPDDHGGAFVAAAFGYRSSGRTRFYRHSAEGAIAWNFALSYHADLQSYESPGSLVGDLIGSAFLSVGSQFLKVSLDGDVLWTTCVPAQVKVDPILMEISRDRPPRLALGSDGSLSAIALGNVVKFAQKMVEAPSATIVLPTGGVSSKPPVNVFLTASATELPVKIEFWDGGSKVHEDLRSPFTFTWNNVPGGVHFVTARYTAKSGVIVTSPPVEIVVVTNLWPAVAILSPTNGSYFVEPATVTLTTAAEDSDGTVTKVAYYAPNYVGESAAGPYSMTFGNLPVGAYTVVAKATDNEGGIGTSAPISFTVLASNAKPVLKGPIADVTAHVASNVTMSAEAFGPGPLQFQWMFGGLLLANQTNKTLVLEGIQGTNSGVYSIAVSSPHGAATNSARLRVVSTLLRLRSIEYPVSGSTALGLSAPTGSVVDLETSTNLVEWMPVQRYTNAAVDFDLMDTNSSVGHMRFYRLSTP